MDSALQFTARTPDETFALGQRIGKSLRPGDIVLMKGGLGAGKTLMTKGIIETLGYDIDEVTSPSFALVNLYKTDTCDVYHIDLWRLESGPAAAEAVGLGELLDENEPIILIEWAEKLEQAKFPVRTIEIAISGDGDDPRNVEIKGLGGEI